MPLTAVPFHDLKLFSFISSADVIHCSSSYALLHDGLSAAPTPLVLHTNRRVRRLRELLFRLCLAARRVLTLCRVATGAFVVLTGGMLASNSYAHDLIRRLFGAVYGCNNRSLNAGLGECKGCMITYLRPSFTLAVWMSFVSPFFALSTLCSSSGSMSVFTLEFVDALLG